jgi:hypothetical protein
MDLIKKENYNFIEKIENLSDSFFKRMRIYFKNGYQLSVISGKYACGGYLGLFEIAPMDQYEKFCPGLFDKEDQGDSVLGHCDNEKVIYYVNKIGNLE